MDEVKKSPSINKEQLASKSPKPDTGQTREEPGPAAVALGGELVDRRTKGESPDRLLQRVADAPSSVDAFLASRDPDKSPNPEMLRRLEYYAENVVTENGTRQTLVNEVKRLMEVRTVSRAQVDKILNAYHLHSVMDEVMKDPVIQKAVYGRSPSGSPAGEKFPASPATEGDSRQEKGARSAYSEAAMTSMIGQIAKIADEAVAENNQARLQAAVDSLPQDDVLRDRVTEVLRRKGIKAERKENKKSPQIDYEAIAQKLTLDLTSPPQAEGILPPMGGNFFAEDDTPTLAGRVAARVYRELINREVKGNQADVVVEDDKGRRDYIAHLNEINKQRIAQGMHPFSVSRDHMRGVDDFHVNGKGYLEDFEFFFNKSRAHWKDNQTHLFRGYVTIDPIRAGEIQRHFVDLSQQLYDAGIDFTAKASGFYGASKRTDNMVFYINPVDQPKASQIMKVFLADRGIGQGHAMAAIPSPQEGLSWAADPDQTQTQVWREIAGTKTEASFNSYVATRLMPMYLTRIAEAHERKGNRQQAAIFRQEAQRTQSIVDRLKPAI